MRAIAIIMMLQGHFINSLLDPAYRDPTNLLYQLWLYCRGITAPTFFTISGMIFTYLLMKSRINHSESKRLRKGLIRGGSLILIGYGLRSSVFDWISGRLSNYFLTIDVLHCIGLSILILCLLYIICFKNNVLYSIVLLLFGIMIFMLEPMYRNIDVTGVPVFIANWVSTTNGSVFTILPWLGYMFLGGCIAGILVRYYHYKYFKITFISVVLLLGILLTIYSSHGLMYSYLWTDLIVFKQAAYYNYLFTRFGNVLIIIAICYMIQDYMAHHLILKIGQKTLSIYVIHYVIIYGSLTGYGLAQSIGPTLLPYQVILGAILFIFIVGWIALYGVKTNKYIYKRIRNLIAND